MLFRSFEGHGNSAGEIGAYLKQLGYEDPIQSPSLSWDYLAIHKSKKDLFDKIIGGLKNR